MKTPVKFLLIFVSAEYYSIDATKKVKISKLNFLDMKNQLIFCFTNSYLIPPFVVDCSQTSHGKKPRHLWLKQSSRAQLLEAWLASTSV